MDRRVTHLEENAAIREERAFTSMPKRSGSSDLPKGTA
jgi:hypothetical protein